MASSSSKAPPVARDGSPLREALSLCGLHLRYAVIFSALVNLAYLARTLYMLQVYDKVVPSGSKPTLAFLTLALTASLFLLTYLDGVRGRLLMSASIRLDKAFSARIFRRAMLDAGGSTPIRLNQFIRDFDTIRLAATGPAALALFDAPWIPIYVIVCYIVHPLIGSIALGGAVVLCLLAVLNERVTRGLNKDAAAAASAGYASQDSASASADVVRALGMTKAFVSQFEQARLGAARPQMQAAKASGRIGGLIRFLRLFLQSVALGAGAWLAISKEISPGAIFASSMLAARALGPIDQIVAQWRVLSSAVTAYDDLSEQLAIAEDVTPTVLPDPAPRLSLNQTSVLTPAGDRALLSGVSLEAEGGQIVGVIGSSGAGKTTLLQVIANARTPVIGEIRLDGARYADWDPQRLGRFIGYLPQDSALFPGTVKDNISRFDAVDGVAVAEVDAKAIAAAKAAGSHEMILSLPKGYDTPLGPRGRGLSAGQQQRVALARALYGDPVLYVLDEPNSYADAESEAVLLKVLADLKARGALVIVAAHRLSLITAVDHIAVLREGRLDRFGPRVDVLAALRGENEAARAVVVAPPAEPTVMTRQAG
ncbi:MAG TPA: type I secretion system permease/ATPase [Caulobacteraceae bacterium]|nr:type I secretion system permease/ATPase [Caulobacteraceae bacterium]